MNRRDLLKLGLGAAASMLVPSWLVKPAPRKIDLTAFCDHRGASRRYDIAAPFIQAHYPRADAEPFGLEFYRYATDSRICVRVPADENDQEGGELRLPPAAKLNWPNRDAIAWRPWHTGDARIAIDSECPDCCGFGVSRYEGDCPTCHGVGSIAMGGLWHSELAMTDCERCMGTGNAGPRCRTCGGKGQGEFPGIVELRSCEQKVYVAAAFERKIRTHLGECEYRVPDAYQGAIQFRFDGGDGLLMPLDRTAAEIRMQK